MSVIYSDARSILMYPGNAMDIATFCIDQATVAAIETALKADPSHFWDVRLAEFALKTDRSWAGPIRHFRLSIDTGDTGAFAMTCASGLDLTDPSRLVWEQHDFVPDRKLDVMFLIRSSG
jgi:hypothetical protein